MKRIIQYQKSFLLILLLLGFSCKKETPIEPLTLPDDLGVEVDFTTTEFQVSWNEIPGASSYTVELSKENGEIVFVNQTLEPNTDFSGLSSGSTYFIRIKGNMGNREGDSPYSDYLPVATRLNPPNPVLTNSNSSTLAFTWAPQAAAVNYILELSLESGELVQTAETSDTEYVFEGLQEEVKYQFRLRAIGARSESEFSDYLTAITTIRAEGFPVSWVFAENNTQLDYLNNPLTPAILEGLQAKWKSDHILKSEAINGYNPDALLSIVSSSGKANSFGYNNGHAYVKGLMYNDYWLYTIPVKNLKANTTLTLHTNVTGSGSGPGPFIIEWSTDKDKWTAAGAKTEQVQNGADEVTVTYTYHQGDNLNPDGQPIIQDIRITEAIEDGNVYIRLRVAADIRVNKNGSSISESGSSRLMSRQLITIKE